jgi:hypothetical protein
VPTGEFLHFYFLIYPGLLPIGQCCTHSGLVLSSVCSHTCLWQHLHRHTSWVLPFSRHPSIQLQFQPGLTIPICAYWELLSDFPLLECKLCGPPVSWCGFSIAFCWTLRTVLKTLQKCSRYLLHDWMWVKAIKLDWIQSNVLVIFHIGSVPFLPALLPGDWLLWSVTPRPCKWPASVGPSWKWKERRTDPSDSYPRSPESSCKGSDDPTSSLLPSGLCWDNVCILQVSACFTIPWRSLSPLCPQLGIHCFIMWIMWEGMLPLESALLSWYEIYDFSEYTENKSTNHPFHVILQVGVCI